MIKFSTKKKKKSINTLPIKISTLHFRSLEKKKLLNLQTYIIPNLIRGLNLSFSINPILKTSSPNLSNIIAPLKSPHVHGKAREIWSQKWYSLKFINTHNIKFLNHPYLISIPDFIWVKFVKLLKLKLPNGISLTITTEIIEFK